eukprot:scaffold3955_cov160-Cylindrotheca_fusiformis.AAC.5
MEGRSLWGKLGMTIFFRRYKLLESANFPWKTKTSLICLIAFISGISLLATQSSRYLRDLAYGLTILAILFFTCLTFLFTAPIIGRVTMIRRAYLIIVHDVLCRFMESIEWCTGTNKTGYMMHLTANKLMQHEYISKEEFEETCTMAIVRNPYSRMVSIYNYNKFGSLESFDDFVKDWYHRMTKPYRERGELDEWYTPCHTIPQHEFTHADNGSKQLVQSIIRQEELKLLKKDPEEVGEGTSVSSLPELVKTALLGMPHTNSRSKGKRWQDYYTKQETLNLVYEMYQRDFEVFGYDPVLKNLEPPKKLQEQDEEQPPVHKDAAEVKKENPSWSLSSFFSTRRQQQQQQSGGSTEEDHATSDEGDNNSSRSDHSAKSSLDDSRWNPEIEEVAEV